MLTIFNIILGAALLVSGRKLFWLFVAAGGFVAGVQFATRVIQGPEWLTLVVGLATGIVFGVLAMFLKSFAIGLAGFFLGGSILTGFASALGFDAGGTNFFIYIIGGIIGIVLVAILFDWALIGLSALGGASLLVQAFDLSRPLIGFAFIGLLVLGITIQAGALRRDGKERDD